MVPESTTACVARKRSALIHSDNAYSSCTAWKASPDTGRVVARGRFSMRFSPSINSAAFGADEIAQNAMPCRLKNSNSWLENVIDVSDRVRTLPCQSR